MVTILNIWMINVWLLNFRLRPCTRVKTGWTVSQRMVLMISHLFVCKVSVPAADGMDVEWQQEEGPFQRPASNTVKWSSLTEPCTLTAERACLNPSITLRLFSMCLHDWRNLGSVALSDSLNEGEGASVKWLPRRTRCLLCRTVFWHLLVRHIQTQITHLDNGLQWFTWTF